MAKCITGGERQGRNVLEWLCWGRGSGVLRRGRTISRARRDLWRSSWLLVEQAEVYTTEKNGRALGAKESRTVLLGTLAQAGMPVLLGLVGRGAANFESDLGSAAAGDVG